MRKEVRVLNRAIRVDEEGLHYEADPRHSDLQIKSMGYGMNSNGAVTPGERAKEVNYEAQLDVPVPCDDHADLDAHDDHGEHVNALKDFTVGKSMRKVSFNSNVHVTEVKPYSKI